MINFRTALKLKDFLAPEDKYKLRDFKEQLAEKQIKEKFPEYNPQEPVASAFSVTPFNVNEKAPLVFKALLKYPKIRIHVYNTEFEIRRTSDLSIYDIIVKSALDINVEEYNTKYYSMLPLSMDSVKFILDKETRYVYEYFIKNKKKAILMRLKLAFLGKTADITPYLEKIIKDAMLTASASLKELKNELAGKNYTKLKQIYEGLSSAVGVIGSSLSVLENIAVESEGLVKTTEKK